MLKQVQHDGDAGLLNHRGFALGKKRRAVQSIYAIPAIVFLTLTGIAILGDWMQARRRKRSPEKIGLIPWPLILVLSLLLAAVFSAFSLRGD